MTLKSKIWISVAVAAVLWFIMFSPWTSPYMPFWSCMSASAIILITLSMIFDGSWLKNIHFTAKNILLGIVIAFTLWCVFYIGDKVSGLMFDFARPEVDAIYSLKSESENWIIGVSLLLLIGPAEELFWRGFIQARLSDIYNPDAAFIITVATYTLVHIWSFNFMLVMAAMVAGGFWGLIYRFKPQWLTALVISHSLWDVAAFVLFPL